MIFKNIRGLSPITQYQAEEIIMKLRVCSAATSLVISFFCSGCSLMASDPYWFDSDLNSLVGRPLPSWETTRSAPFRVVQTNEQFEEREYELPNKCRYVLHLRKPDGLVQSWHYKSDPKLCNHDFDRRSH